MNNMNINICLSDIQGAFTMDIKGQTSTQRCLCLPIEMAHLNVGKNGKVYLNAVAWERKTPSQYGDSHMIKMSYNQAEREAMKNAGKEDAIIGDVKPFAQKETANNVTPQGSPYQVPPTENEALPF